MLRLTVCCLLVFCVLIGWGQPGPGQPNQPNKPPAPDLLSRMTPDDTVIEIAPRGIYLIHGGVVARYGANLGQPTVRELFGPLPNQPAVSDKPTDAERAATQEWLTQFRLRNAPMSAISDAASLHIVIGARYFRVNMETLDIVAQGDLSPAKPGAGTPVINQAPLLKLADTVLLVVTAHEIIMVNTVDGNVLSRAVPPVVMFPQVDFKALRLALGPSSTSKPNPPVTPKPPNH